MDDLYPFLFFIEFASAIVILRRCIYAAGLLWKSFNSTHKARYIGVAVGFSMIAYGTFQSIINFDGGRSDFFLILALAIYLESSRRFKK